jgi:hypothetical protein
MKAILRTCVLLLATGICLVAYAAEPLAPYDDFMATNIAPDKWRDGGEAIRELRDNQLHLVFESHGQTDSNRGRPRETFVQIFRDSAAVTAIQAKVRVTDVKAQGCSSNPAPTVASAMIGGVFFGTPTGGSGGTVRDTVAFIGVGSDSSASSDMLWTRSTVYFCANRDCTYGTELHGQFMGAVKRGETVTLRIQWDRDNHRFIFQRGDAPEVIAPYAVSDTEPPGTPVKFLSAMHFVPNCTTTPRPMAYIEAWFDDVRVNASAAPRSEQ